MGRNDYTNSLTEKVTGQQAKMKIYRSNVNSGNQTPKEVTFSSFSWSRDVETTEVRHNDDLKPKLVRTGMSYSGSFEFEGSNFDLMSELFNDGATSNDLGTTMVEDNEPPEITITLKETVQEGTGSDSEKTHFYTFKRCTITSYSKDINANDTFSVTGDWEAEDVSAKTSASSVTGFS